jgi:hypothetical protein
MLPENTFLSEDPRLLRAELIDNYRNVAEYVNGTIKEFIPTMNNCTVTEAQAVYFRQGLTTDIWFSATWSLGTGDIEINMPFTSKLISSEVWRNPVSFDNVTLSVNYTSVVAGVTNNTNVLSLFEIGSGQALQPLTATSGTVSGLIRFIGQENA